MHRIIRILIVLFAAAFALPTGSQVQSAAPTRVLFVGNSYTYVNNLPALFVALANAQPGRNSYEADLIAAPGGSIAERWQDGVAAGEIASGRWQVLVLQERGGQLACLGKPNARSEPECQAIVAAHRKFAALAKRHGMRVLLFGTWGPDAIWQGQLSRGLRKLADATSAEAVDIGADVRAYGEAHAETKLYTDSTLHPALDASLLAAGRLYRQIEGRAAEPIAFETQAALLPTRAAVRADRPLSQQADMRGDGGIVRIDAARLRPLLAATTAP
ncbi:hypothetical protein [Arenimonas sp.]|uniref:hypothetical protein n=1 Tax=Arenimonas sp. TaxID=1872635 RepID=UPI0039E57A37